MQAGKMLENPFLTIEDNSGPHYHCKMEVPILLLAPFFKLHVIPQPSRHCLHGCCLCQAGKNDAMLLFFIIVQESTTTKLQQEQKPKLQQEQKPTTNIL